MFNLKQLCNTIKVDKSKLNKINDKSSNSSQKLKYSSYVKTSRHNYSKVIETQIQNIHVISSTSNSVIISLEYFSKPFFISIVLKNENEMHTYPFYADNPYTLIGLTPNTIYNIVISVTYYSGNQYTSTFLNAIQTKSQ